MKTLSTLEFWWVGGWEHRVLYSFNSEHPTEMEAWGRCVEEGMPVAEDVEEWGEGVDDTHVREHIARQLFFSAVSFNLNSGSSWGDPCWLRLACKDLREETGSTADKKEVEMY